MSTITNTKTRAGIVPNSVTHAATPISHFYRVVWRWHFYAGLFVAPFLVMLALTGMIIMFENQLNDVLYRPLVFVTPQGQPVPYTQQLATVQHAYPTMAMRTVQPGATAERSTKITLSDDTGSDVSVFVDPYTGAILGERNNARSLTGIANTMHGTFLLGDFGDRMIELAAGWGIVLTVSGVYLWWPRKANGIWGILLPRLRAGRRIFWRDIHAVPGFYVALLLIFLLVTGMTWTGVWGEWSQVWSIYPPQMWDDVPPSTVVNRSLNDGTTKIIPWATEVMPMPQSGGEHNAHGDDPSTTNRAIDRHGMVTLDTVIALARSEGAPPTFNVSLPADETGVYTVSASSAGPELDDATKEMTMHIDQYSGHILAKIGWDEYGAMARAVSLGIAMHEGKQFGLINKAFSLFACLAVIMLAVSGVVMWWQRRPKGHLGAPAMPKQVPVWKGAVALMVVLSALFPLVGMSLVVVLALDWLVIGRVPVLKRALR